MLSLLNFFPDGCHLLCRLPVYPVVYSRDLFGKFGKRAAYEPNLKERINTYR